MINEDSITKLHYHDFMGLKDIIRSLLIDFFGGESKVPVIVSQKMINGYEVSAHVCSESNFGMLVSINYGNDRYNICIVRYINDKENNVITTKVIREVYRCII